MHGIRSPRGGSHLDACPDCGHAVSLSAARCPHCGAAIFGRGLNWAMGCLIIWIVGAILWRLLH